MTGKYNVAWGHTQVWRCVAQPGDIHESGGVRAQPGDIHKSGGMIAQPGDIHKSGGV